jgi:hypothetical protein
MVNLHVVTSQPQDHNDVAMSFNKRVYRHIYIVVRDFLDAMFSGKWIGHAGPISWSPRSPVLTPSDFSLLGFLKDVCARSFVIWSSGSQRRLTSRTEICCSEYGEEVGCGWDISQIIRMGQSECLPCRYNYSVSCHWDLPYVHNPSLELSIRFSDTL